MFTLLLSVHIISLVRLVTAYIAITSHMQPEGIPLGMWLAFKKHLGLHGLWMGLTVSLIYCATLGTYICIRTNWHREVQKVLARLADNKGRDVEPERDS